MHRKRFASEETWVLVSGSAGVDLKVRLGDGPHVLGSGSNADVRIVHPTVSRTHCRLHLAGSAATVEDLGSTNGTHVDGVRLTGPVEVSDRAVLTCGRVRLDLERGETPKPMRGAFDSGISSSGSLLLGDATVGFMRAAGREVAFPEGAVVVRRGEKQDAIFVVIEGEIDLLLKEGDAVGRPLARLGEGAIFGAESVIGSHGAAVDAVAVSDVRLLRYPASQLPAALQESASLRKKLLGGMARNLHDAASDALDLLKGTEVITRLVLGDQEAEDLVTESARMRAVRKKIEQVARSDASVLITGDDGTGRTLAARLIHASSARASGPLIAVNCADLNPDHAGELIFGQDLAGRLPTGQRGSGGIHLAHGGSLVLRGVDTLNPGIRELLSRHLALRDSASEAVFPDTRIMLTSRPVSKTGDEAPGSDPAENVEAVIDLPPLVDRPKDILPLAETFLARHGPDAPRLTEGAKHALLSMRFGRRNVAELREVVDLAVRIADGPEILPEHLFSGVGDEGVPGVDITARSPVRQLLKPSRTAVVRAGALVGFLAVIAAALGLASARTGRLANLAIWSAWEPVVFALFLLAGPVWCTVCPLSTAGRLAKRTGCADRPPPPWMKRHGPWLCVVGFALIVWAERVFHAPGNPLASAILLACLIVAAVVFGMIYRREVWCRYLCPLGRLATTLAPASPLQLSAKQRVCASTCTSHACFKGNERVPGCTVFHHPLEGKQAHRCKLCLDCLKSCPHGSAQLQLRVPLAAVWRLDSGAADLGLFAISVSILALVLAVASRVEVLRQPVVFTAACIGAIAAGAILHSLLMRTAATEEARATRIRTSVVAMMIGWSALMAVQLANIPFLRETRIIRPADWGLPLWMPLEVTGLWFLQGAVLLFGTVLAFMALARVRALCPGPRTTTRWAAVGLVFAVYVGLVLVFGVG